MEINTDKNLEQTIIQVAEKLFLEKGFALVTTTEIANLSGCNQALVHYYYRTKEKLFEAVFEKKAQLFVSTILQINDENIPFEEKLKRKIEIHFDMLKANPKLPFLLFNEFITNQSRIAVFKAKLGVIVQPFIHQLKRELDIEIANGTIRPISIIDLMITMISLNVTFFLASPIIQNISGMTDDDMLRVTEQRKQENVRIILGSLKP